MEKEFFINNQIDFCIFAYKIEVINTVLVRCYIFPDVSWIHVNLTQELLHWTWVINVYYFVYREDGTFIISNVPSGSYIVEVVNPNYAYEPVRVEINSKGKFRARKVNLIQTSQVIQVPYPLKIRPLAPFRYFQLREQWRVTDFLFNPMVRWRPNK